MLIITGLITPILDLVRINIQELSGMIIRTLTPMGLRCAVFGKIDGEVVVEA
jgi:hypothetical protein